jgi:hypothetical protein
MSVTCLGDGRSGCVAMILQPRIDVVKGVMRATRALEAPVRSRRVRTVPVNSELFWSFPNSSGCLGSLRNR